MDVRELLALEANAASIKKIDQFLSTKSSNDRDYPKAISHLAYLTYQLGDVSGSFQLLFNYLEKCVDKEKPTVYNTLIKIYYLQEDYENVLKMIEAKRVFLPSYNKSAYFLDLIDYYTKIGDEVELRRNLLIYLADDISDERRLNALITLANLLYKNEEYELFNEKNKLIQTLSLSLKEEKIYLNAKYMEAYVLVLLGSYPNALIIIDELLNDNIDKDLKAKLLALNLKIYVSLSEYRKASIFEAENEHIINEGSIDAKLMFCSECIKLYTALNNKFNKNSYEERYNQLLEESKKNQVVEEKTPKKKKIKQQKIELNFLKAEKETVKRPVQSGNETTILNEEIIQVKDITKIKTASIIDEVSNLFIDLNKQVFSQFRDYLRQFFIIMNKVCIFNDAYLLVRNKEYKGYHYKKERLYDKKNISITDTIFEEVISENSELIIPDTKKTSYADIITNKPYVDLDSLSIIAFPFSDGAILFSYSNDEILIKELNYELLKLGISYLNLKYNSEKTELFLLEKYHDYIFIMEHMNAGWKRQIDNYIYLSQNACEMFKSRDAITLDEYYNYIYSPDLVNYRMELSQILNGNKKQLSILFRSDRTGSLRYYQEDFKVDESGVILSLINDITDKIKREEENVKMAQYDPLSGLNNKMKLDSDLDNLIKGNKFSLLALNIINFKKYNDIYGYDFGEQLIFAVGKYLKEYDDKITCYHLDGDKFVVSIDGINDKRTVAKYAYNLCEYLTNKLMTLNYRLNIYFEVGILRYPTDTTEVSHHKLIDYLLSALTSAKSLDLKTNVSCYNKEDYKKQFLNSQLITYISEAIDSNQLALNYQQVVDISNNTCECYNVSLNLSNFSVGEDLIYEVIRKRDMVATTERYIIHKALFELAEIYKKVKLYFNVSFKISEETLLSENFRKYIEEQLEFFKIPKTAVNISYNGNYNDNVYDVLKDLAINQFFLSTSNFEIVKNLPILYFVYEIPKVINKNENDFMIMLKSYCDSKNIRFIIIGVNNNQLISHYAPLGFNLYQGKVYKANLTFKDIIKAFLA